MNMLKAAGFTEQIFKNKNTFLAMRAFPSRIIFVKGYVKFLKIFANF